MRSPAWFKRFWADLTTKEFIAIKVLFFLIYGASMAMFPFLTLQARSLGITETELGVVYAFNPVIAIIGPPITGIMADKIGNFKVFLSITMAASGCAALVFSAVPAARIHHEMPDTLPLSVSCGATTPAIELQSPYYCDYLPQLDNVTFTLTNCSLCHSRRASQPGGGEVLNMTPQEVTAFALTTNTTTLLQLPDWQCPNLPLQSDDDATEDSSTVPSAARMSDCDLSCSSTLRREDLCSNTISTEVIDPMVTFWSYMLVRLLNGLTLATSFTLFDGAAIAILKQYSGEYGLQRLYANLGAIVVTPVSGVLIDVFSDMSGTQNYNPAFYLYCGFKMFAAVIILFVDLDFRQPSSRVMKDFRILLKKPEILTFLLVMLISGTCFGLLDTFLFWLLQDLGAKKFLMGITVTVGSMAGIPTLIASGFFLEKLGHANTIIIGFAFYVIRMMGYSFLTNPWWCMPFEALECFTVSLMGTAAVSYAAELSTPATIATLQGVYGGIHYGVGRGLGSLIGGFLMGPLGVRNTFRLMALVCAVTCLTYFIINHVFFRQLQQERADEMKAEEAKKEEAEKEQQDPEKGHNGIIENGFKYKNEKETKENDTLEGKLKENGTPVLSNGKENINEAFEENE
ncbi:major facilitator superfamily domain-containing protein 6-like [Homarus americanus]|uniref:major facilitator superfamily domain-containing protein 6-like n=1 Tax=Homarus americanus TaxID=6706 RepID=UPI001C46D65B|nr:major facilitator superfamily domain-containing protein 6-like [Homarus americanus]XP_042222972.1 major facilitator superfamily domain-containing protein 6-like [Homarus americanus]XP_042222973.1 major facilitator superfamily domain-containing protein 6-like [Homarus americanus]XP_042222975.1 major facilitator superfamily domain-containing protein 6-like [Homarus americanus]XP_042222976.1 major facilitator superfamily domain-containing protein 6-like [Homarus americanus]